MPELVTIPIALFEFVADYERPEFWADRTSIVQAIFAAFEPWQPCVDDMDLITTGKISEQGVTIKLPQKRTSFFFGAASCKFARDGVDWHSTEETLAILDAAVSALTKHGGVAFVAKNAAISMHIQPRSLSFIALLSPFLPHQLAVLDSAPVTTMATVAKWANHKVTLDGSAALANAIFLRLERDFPGSVGYEEMANQIRHDEEDLFRILGIEEDQG